MRRPQVELADIICAHGEKFVEQHPGEINYDQLKVLKAIQQCRTAALGGHLDQCDQCGHRAISYNSCLMESFF